MAGLRFSTNSTGWSFTNGRSAISANSSSPKWRLLRRPIFILGVMGLVGMLRGEGGSLGARVLLNAMVWPIVLYFAWHTFHGRVEGNWPEPIYAAFVIAAAAAVDKIKWNGAWAAVARWSQRLAVPVGLAIAACIYSAGGLRHSSARPPSIRPRARWAPAGRNWEPRSMQVRAQSGRTDRIDQELWTDRLAFVLSALASAGRADQRAHMVRECSRAGSGLVSRLDDVCLHCQVPGIAAAPATLHDRGIGDELDADAARRAHPGL